MSEPARAGTRAGLVWIGVAAVTLALTSQCLRVLFPLVYLLGERTSFISAGFTALLVFLAPALTPLVVRPFGPRRVLVTVAGVAAVRVAMQVWHPIPLSLAVAGAAVGLVALTAQLGAARPEGRAVTWTVGIVVGLALDTALRSAFWTWDHVWQKGFAALGTSIALSAAAVAISWLLPAPAGVARTAALRVAAFGPFLWLHAMFLNSPAFLASETSVSLPWASATVIAADALAVALVTMTPRPERALLPLLAGATVLVAWVMGTFTGALVAVAVVALIPLTALLLHGAMTAPAGLGLWGTSLAVAAGSLGFAVFVFAYHIHYDQPLPISNEWLLPAAAALLAAGALGGRGVTAHPDRSLVPVTCCAALLLVPAVMGVTDPEPETGRGGPGFTVMTYNLHSGVDGDGQLDPESMARVIESRAPDVLVLQEVNRGWAIAGAIDAAEWLSRRLDTPYVYSPAANGQFGNAIFTRLPIADSKIGLLPAAGGPQTRSYVMIRLGDGLTVMGAHLQHRRQDIEARLEEIDVLLSAWDGARPAIIAGDLNAVRGSREIRRLQGAGLHSADAGGPDIPTWPSSAPRLHLDWIFGTSDVEFTGFEVMHSRASDHRPVIATVSTDGE